MCGGDNSQERRGWGQREEWSGYRTLRRLSLVSMRPIKVRVIFLHMSPTLSFRL